MKPKEIDIERASQLKASGVTYQKIAADLGVHPCTLRNHMNGDIEYHGKEHKITNIVNGYIKPVALPKSIVFDLKVGDTVTAREPEVSPRRRKYEVTWIGKETYACRCIDGKYNCSVTFQIKEYGKPCDSGHVIKVIDN